MSVYCNNVSRCSSVCRGTSCAPCQSAPFGPIRGSGETKYKQFPAKVLRAQQHLITCQLRSRRYDLGQMSKMFVLMIFLLFWGWLHVILNAFIFDCILTVIYCSFGISCIVYWQQLDIFLPDSIWHKKIISKHKCAPWSLLHDQNYFNHELFREPNPKRGDQP